MPISGNFFDKYLYQEVSIDMAQKLLKKLKYTLRRNEVIFSPYGLQLTHLYPTEMASTFKPISKYFKAY